MMLQSKTPLYINCARFYVPSSPFTKKLETLGVGSVDLSYNKELSIAKITISNEKKKNAFSGKMMIDFGNAIQDLEKWKEGKGVILEAKGDTFCSGGDLGTVRAICNPEEGEKMCAFMQDITHRLKYLPLISLTVVHGKALGGGAELVTSTDFRLFTESGNVAFVQPVMGVTTGWGGATRLKHIIGYNKALQTLLSNETINSSKALKIGLANGIISSENRSTDAELWLSNISRHHKKVLKGIKRGVSYEFFDNGYNVEKIIFKSLWGGPEHVKKLDMGIKHKDRQCVLWSTNSLRK